MAPRVAAFLKYWVVASIRAGQTWSASANQHGFRNLSSCLIGIRAALLVTSRHNNSKGEQSYMENIMNMKKTFALWLLAASLMIGIATVGYAQDTTTTPYGNSPFATDDQRGPKLTVLAGCLERGSGADEYALRGPRMQWWELKSDSVDLGIFRDEEVRVTAVKSPDNDGTLTVTDVFLVSTSCVSR